MKKDRNISTKNHNSHINHFITFFYIYVETTLLITWKKEIPFGKTKWEKKVFGSLCKICLFSPQRSTVLIPGPCPMVGSKTSSREPVLGRPLYSVATTTCWCWATRAPCARAMGLGGMHHHCVWVCDFVLWMPSNSNSLVCVNCA